MSHRTTPVFQQATRWNTFSSPQRHSRGDALLPSTNARDSQQKSLAVSAQSQSSHVLFDALDFARFDQVRRAVSLDPVCLRARKPPPPSITTSTADMSLRLSPVDYALNNCRTWTALLEHCERTGIAIPYAGDLTFRERIKAMNTIIAWLLSHPMVIAPTGTPLHTAISYNFDVVCERLVQAEPSLAASTDARGKTPLHVCCSLSSRISTTDAVKYVRLLVSAGADINARDVEGCTPLHDLVTFLSVTSPSYGLVRRRRKSPSLAVVAQTVDALLMHGASLYITDKRGASPLDIALATGADYLVLAHRAAILYGKVCYTPYAKRCADEQTGIPKLGGVWGALPDDVIVRIFRYLSPKDAVSGVGSTCKALRRVAVSEHLWRHFDTSYCMSVVRNSVIRKGVQNPNATGTTNARRQS